MPVVARLGTVPVALALLAAATTTPAEGASSTSPPNPEPSPARPSAASGGAAWPVLAPWWARPSLQDDLDEATPLTPDGFRFAGTYMSLWGAEAAARIGLDATNTIPYVLPPETLFDRDLYVWDAWPVRLADGEIAAFDGWTILVGLSSRRESDSPSPFFTRSTWRYWFGKDGEWQLGGEVFSREAALGSRQWAGSSVYDPDSGRVTFYYTAVGALDAPSLEEDQPELAYPPDHPAYGRPSTVQRMAAVSAVVTAGDQGVTFDDFGEHRLLLEADGRLYQTQDQSITDRVIYGMRDPWYYRAPGSDRGYLLFTANAAFAPGTHNGVVGIARETEAGAFELLPPILGAPGVSSQLERPHLVRRGERLYLLFSTHAFTFADGFSGPEGLYGFVSETGDLAGPWLPLNGSGLVAGNPDVAATMVYSYLVLQDGWVTSYLNMAGGELTAAMPGKFFGGPAPMFRVGFDGARTAIVDVAAER